MTHSFFHIIHSYDMRPYYHGLDLKTFQNEGSTYGTSSKEPYLANKESASFIHSYVPHSSSFIGQCEHQLYLGCNLRL